MALYKKQAIFILLTIVMLCLQVEGKAQHLSDVNMNFDIGTSVTRFKYKEYGSGDEILDSESGNIPGLRLTLGMQYEQWHLIAETEWQSATLAYRGLTNNGRSQTTTSDASFHETTIVAGRRFPQLRDDVLFLYTGIGYRQWMRRIASTNSAIGLNERYKWPYSLIGINYRSSAIGLWKWDVDIRLGQSFNSTLDVDFLSNFDATTVELGRSRFERIALRVDYETNRNGMWSTEFYSNTWKTERGPSSSLQRNGNIVGTVFEPRSMSRTVGADIKWTMTF